MAAPDAQLAGTPSLNVAIFNTCLQQGNEVCKDVVQDLCLIRACDNSRSHALQGLRQSYESARASGAIDSNVVDGINQNLCSLLKVSNASVQLADVAYAQLDVSILLLDRKLKLMENILRKQVDITCSQLDAAASANEGARPPRLEALRDSIVGSSSVAALALPDGSSAPRGRPTGRGGSGGRLRSMGGGSMDLAVEEDEPTYCSCDQVAFGEMIACDNPSCTIEWYHCLCVGITPANKPSGQWLCPACSRGDAASASEEEQEGAAGAGAGSSAAQPVSAVHTSTAADAFPEPVRKKARQQA